MASTSLVAAVCERIIEKLKKENPGVEYKKKVAKCKTPKKSKRKSTISKKSQREILKKMKKPDVLN